MGDQVELQQQTRVLLLNGQTIILQGDVGDNSINEINTDIIEQALQEAGNNNGNEDNQSSVTEEQHDNLTSHSSTDPSSTTASEHQENEANLEAADDGNNFVAIFENENGETQTVQLTLEQAAALGFQVEHNAVTEKEDLNSVTPISELKDTAQFSDSHNETDGRLPQSPANVTSSQIMVSPNTTQQQNSTILGSLLKPSSPSMISLVPHYVGNPNSMSYAVKLQDSINTTNSGVSDIIIPSTANATIQQNTVNTSHSLNQSQAISMTTQPGSSLLNQKLTIPVANKNIGIIRQQQRSVVKLKSQMSTSVSPAILRPATTKTVIPKIQGTPTSMANLAMTSATPISSTASMVRVLNTPSSLSSSVLATTNTKPVTSTAITTTPVKSIDKSTVPIAATNSSKPLGSSENPIQLVQHGQTFHSMQPLSQEQLKQIATVLQQKQLDTSRNSKNVLFDATTNTRIIYRVVYPEDLALKKPSSGMASSSSASLRGTGRGGGRKGRPPKSLSKTLYGKKLNSDEEEDQLLDSDLSKGEKEERKKVLPRTRSGRLSRPPRHMVKDYKRIHHLDFAEPDLDDSDGGYSDYRISDSEPVPDSALEDMPIDNLPLNQEIQETGVVKRAIHSKFRCPTCQKMYLGYRRLARHFEAYPDHGSMENVPKTTIPRPIVGTVETPENVNGTIMMRPIASSSRGGRGTGKRRGNPFFLSPAERSERRKAKLREFLTGYEPSVVTEIAGPLVAQSLDAWQLMLLRVAACEDEPTRVAALLAEMAILLGKARSSLPDLLMPYSEHSVTTNKAHKIELKDEVVASALNISSGVYSILESDDRKLQWCPASLIEAANSTPISQTSLSVDLETSQADSGETAPKKQRLWNQEEEEDQEQEVSHKMGDMTTDKTFLDSTTESEKPSDTSICSDTPLDDIVKAELKNLANKSGLDDFVAPPPPVSTSNNLGHASEVDFVATPFPSSEQSADASSHFPTDIVINMPSTTSETSSVEPSDSTPSSTNVPSKHSENNMHFQLATSSRLDLNEGSIDVNLDSHLEETTHTIDFEAFSEDFHTNTQS